MHVYRTLNGEKVLQFLIVALSAAALTWGTPALSSANGGKGRDKEETKEKVKMAASAKFKIQEAVEAALAKVPGTVIEAELEEVPRVTWEVEIVTTDGKLMDVLVDVDTGAVVGVEEEQPESEGENEAEKKVD